MFRTAFYGALKQTFEIVTILHQIRQLHLKVRAILHQTCQAGSKPEQTSQSYTGLEPFPRSDRPHWMIGVINVSQNILVQLDRESHFTLNMPIPLSAYVVRAIIVISH